MISTTHDTLGARLVRQEDLTSRERHEMLVLFETQFDNVEAPLFLEDLQEKDHVLLIEHATAGIVGFTTLLVYPTVFRDEEISVLFSGDTIVAPIARRSPVLSTAWIGAVESLRSRCPSNQAFYWFLICSGYRTYRFLPLFFEEFFPRHNSPTPPHIQQLMHQLAQERYGKDYDADRGVVRLSGRQTPLRSGVGEITNSRRKNPHISYFETRNPRHVAGEELVCITQPIPTNMTRAGARMLALAPSQK